MTIFLAWKSKKVVELYFGVAGLFYWNLFDFFTSQVRRVPAIAKKLQQPNYLRWLTKIRTFLTRKDLWNSRHRKQIFRIMKSVVIMIFCSPLLLSKNQSLTLSYFFFSRMILYH